jgi:hypothetical protein
MNKQLFLSMCTVTLFYSWYNCGQEQSSKEESKKAEISQPADSTEMTSPHAIPDTSENENHRNFHHTKNADSKTQDEILHLPLQYISPSIKRFESGYIQPVAEAPAPSEFKFVPASSLNRQSQFDATPLAPLKAPLAFISPSIRAFPYVASLAKEKNKIPFTYDLSGYIKNEAFFDSYQVYGARQDQYLIIPLPPRPDRRCNNINNHGRFNMLEIESRVRGEIAGPYIFGAQTYAVGEIDAWGSSNNDLQMGLLRVRHAFIYFEWEDKSLLMGQYWHPLLLPECYADTISFNGGTPFDTFAREPQIRLTKQFDNMTFIVAAGALPTSPFSGPIGSNSIYARNGIMPNFNMQLFGAVRSHLFGLGVDASRIVPRLVTDKNFCVTESLFSVIAFAFSSFNWDNLGLRLKLIYAQNGDPFGLISGYAVSKIDPYTDERKYSNIQCVNAWLDTAYRGNVEPGIFMGVSKNVGATSRIKPDLVYADFGKNIDFAYRIQPRVRWFIKPLIFGAEMELTGARYGTTTETGHVVNGEFVNNLRVLLSAFYIF